MIILSNKIIVLSRDQCKHQNPYNWKWIKSNKTKKIVIQLLEVRVSKKSYQQSVLLHKKESSV